MSKRTINIVLKRKLFNFEINAMIRSLCSLRNNGLIIGSYPVSIYTGINSKTHDICFTIYLQQGSFMELQDCIYLCKNVLTDSDINNEIVKKIQIKTYNK